MYRVGKLSPVSLRSKGLGLHADGRGLYLQCKNGGRSWVHRYMLNKRARWMGLGPFPDVSLAEAREAADKNRKLLRDGVDPIEQKKLKRLASQLEAAKSVPFGKCAADYIAEHRAGWKNAKHIYQWEATFIGRKAATASINALPVASIDTNLVLQVLRPIWTEKPETASRIRGRIERVLAWATVSELRQGENPARWRGHLSEMLPAKSNVHRVQHLKALAFSDMPIFMQELRERNSVSARALEFLILTAARTGEAIGARWDEFDFAQKVWTVPAERMKAKRPHRVPLSNRALEILAEMPRDGELVFPGASAGKPLSDMAMLELLRGMVGEGYTVHGFRSSFRDWAAERTNFPNHVVEMALAHVVADKVEAAYRRGDLFEKRRQLMTAWAKFCASPAIESAKVIEMRRSV